MKFNKGDEVYIQTIRMVGVVVESRPLGLSPYCLVRTIKPLIIRGGRISQPRKIRVHAVSTENLTHILNYKEV